MSETIQKKTLYQCPRCTVQWSGPDGSEDRVCECSHVAHWSDDTMLESIGTIEADEAGWTRLGPSAETLQKGFGIRYENDLRKQLEDGGPWQDWDTKHDPVPGEIIGVEETRYGPRYEVSPDTDWWHPGRDLDEEPPIDHVWHWDIVEVTERTRASVRLEEIKQDREATDV